MSQKLTILFDLDGTLIDTAPDLMSAHNHVMKKFGYIERELDDIKKLAGRGSKVMIKKSIHEIAESTGKIVSGATNVTPFVINLLRILSCFCFSCNAKFFLFFEFMKYYLYITNLIIITHKIFLINTF